jgi:hypothetical protein
LTPFSHGGKIAVERKKRGVSGIYLIITVYEVTESEGW